MLAVAPAPPPVPVPAVVGRSARGRRIRAVRVGPRHARVRVLVVGCIHGNETAGRAVVHALGRSRPPRGVALWLVPSANPDGDAAGTRQNARGVDLNRNFPWRWRPDGPRWSVHHPGPRPSSEPETRVVERLVRRMRPVVSVWYHQHARLVYRQGGARPALIRSYARRAGLPLRRSPPLTGTAIGWENRLLRRGTAWVVELPPGRLGAASARRHARAVLAVATGAAAGSRPAGRRHPAP